MGQDLPMIRRLEVFRGQPVAQTCFSRSADFVIGNASGRSIKPGRKAAYL